MGKLNPHHYSKSTIQSAYWDAIADYLSCCEKEINELSDELYSHIRWNETKICFQSLLYQLEIPEAIHEKIAEEIRCPECGSKIDLNSFVSINYRFKAERNRKKLENYINESVHGEICKFIKFLQRYPLLGMSDNTGKAIAKEIFAFPQINIKDEIWYRGRLPEKNHPEKIFSSKEMYKPPREIAREGRFNHYGQPVLYLGSNDMICAEEIIGGNYQIICWIQEIKVKDVKILDLTKYYKVENLANCPLFIAGLIVSGQLEIHNSENMNFYKPEYAITRFVADLCRYYGIEGIKYNSSVSNDGYNLVLFCSNEDKVEFIGEPKLYNGDDKIFKRLKMGETEVLFLERK